MTVQLRESTVRETQTALPRDIGSSVSRCSASGVRTGRIIVIFRLYYTIQIIITKCTIFARQLIGFTLVQ